MTSTMTSSSNASLRPTPKSADTTAPPSGPSETFEVIGRYGNVIATAGSLELAKQDVRYRIANLGQTGLSVQRVTVQRVTVYKPRLVSVLPS